MPDKPTADFKTDPNTGITVGIHQPNFMPWIGYFYKMLHSDIFVLLDDVQYIRRGYTGRVKIKAKNGETWLSIPVQKKGRYHQRINDVSLETETAPVWIRKVLGTLQTCYGKAPFFKEYFSPLKNIIERIPQSEQGLLVDLNVEILAWLAAQLEIKTKIVNASELDGITGESTKRLVSICGKLGANHYLSGFGGQQYQDEALFTAQHIGLTVYDFQHPVYPQMFEDFIPGLSAVDLLFNCGPQSPEILRNIKKLSHNK